MYASESYVIRLYPHQSIELYGYTFDAKKTLSWKDIINNDNITLIKCIECNIPPPKLYKLQPNIKEWVKLGKIKISHFHIVYDHWKPHIFNDFNGNLGDLITYKEYIQPRMLIEKNIKFQELVEKYGLAFENMKFLNYSLDNWIRIGMTEQFINSLNEEQIIFLFGKNVSIQSLLEMIQRFQN